MPIKILFNGKEEILENEISIQELLKKRIFAQKWLLWS